VDNNGNSWELVGDFWSDSGTRVLMSLWSTLQHLPMQKRS